ncbi:Alpha-1,3-mannosyl-glycoprotein 2-beta-N-acetylglucosaminyltransferase [Linum perenne]
MAKMGCDFRYLLLPAALLFIYVQMRLFTTQSEYADRLASAIESESHCTSQMKLLIDQISSQQGRIVALEEEKKRRQDECKQLKFLVEDFQKQGLQKVVTDVQVPVAAVVIMACNRADYLERTVESVTKYQSSVASKFPLFVSQDGPYPDVKSKAMSYTHLVYMQHLDSEPLYMDNPGELIAYYKIARHYKWALDQLFYKHKFNRVIILEDDMEIAPDFFQYFEAAASLLDKDKSIMAVSSWNDNGQKQFVHDPCKALLM